MATERLGRKWVSNRLSAGLWPGPWSGFRGVFALWTTRLWRCRWLWRHKVKEFARFYGIVDMEDFKKKCGDRWCYIFQDAILHTVWPPGTVFPSLALALDECVSPITSKPATPRWLIHIRFLDADKGLFNYLGSADFSLKSLSEHAFGCRQCLLPKPHPKQCQSAQAWQRTRCGRARRTSGWMTTAKNRANRWK